MDIKSLAVVPIYLIVEPELTAPLTPSPPETINAPVALFVDAVVFDSVIAPLPAIVNAAASAFCDDPAPPAGAVRKMIEPPAWSPVLWHPSIYL